MLTFGGLVLELILVICDFYMGCFRHVAALRSFRVSHDYEKLCVYDMSLQGCDCAKVSML